MNQAGIAGIVTAILTIFLSTRFVTGTATLWWQPIPVLMILLGSLSAIMVSFRFHRVWILVSVFFRRLGGYNRRNNQQLIHDIGLLARARRQSFERFVETRKIVKDYFLKDAAGLFEWAQAEIDGTQLRDVLNTRSETIYRRYVQESQVFARIAIIPALMGGLITMLALVSRLSGFDEEGAIGGIANLIGRSLIPLLYGCAVSALILKPIAENLMEASEEEHTARMIVVEGMMMIFDKLPPQFIEEKIKSFLLPTERMSMQKHTQNAG